MLIVLGAIALVACNDSRPDLPEPFSTVEDEFLAAMQADRDRRCPRPVVIEMRLPGSAQDDAVALWETDASFNACLEAFDEQTDAMTDWLAWPFGKMPDEVARLVEPCQPVRNAILRAAAHEEACSPYLLGRRVFPIQTGIRCGRVMKASSILVAADLANERVPDALELSLAAWAVTQDLVRGRNANLIATYMARMANWFAASNIRSVLAHPGVSSDALAGLEQKFEVLAAARPSPGEAVASMEWDWLANGIIPGLRPSWPPPWGIDKWSVGLSSSTWTDETTREAAGMMDAQRADIRAVVEACPVRASVASCVQQLSKLQSEVGVQAKRMVAGSGDFDFFLDAARIQARSRIRGRCPKPEDLAGPEWSAMARDSVTGSLMRARVDSSGSLVLARPLDAMPSGGGSAGPPDELAIPCVLP